MREKKTKITNIGLIFLLLTLFACGGGGGGGGGGGTPADTTPPAVTSTSPANGATGVAVNATISATFSEVMDASTITTATFTVSGVAGTVAYSETTATFTPSGNLANNTTYTATITTGAKDAAGNPLANNYTWSFTTQPPAPTGVSVSAGNEQVTISWNAVSGALSYNIYWLTASGVNKTNGTKIEGAATPYTHTGLTNEITYYYVVTAVNDNGESVESTEVSATPALQPPPPPG